MLCKFTILTSILVFIGYQTADCEWTSWSACSVSCGRGYQYRQCKAGAQACPTGHGLFAKICDLGTCLNITNVKKPLGKWRIVKGQVFIGGDQAFQKVPTASTTTTTTSATTKQLIANVVLDTVVHARVNETEKKEAGDWTEWSHCSNTCGNGIKVRTRKDCNIFNVSGISIPTCDGEVRDLSLCVGQSDECSMTILTNLKFERNETNHIHQSGNRFVTHAILAFTALILTAAACVSLFSILLVKLKKFNRNRY
ncbi:hypothetical protein ScPMuIL_009753 [Solemya velum]